MDDGPERPSWRREDAGRNLEQTNDDLDAGAKKNRKFSQEQKRGVQTEKVTRLKENNTAVDDQRSNNIKRDKSTLDIRERSQRSRMGPDFQPDDHQRKHHEVNRRQGPIKPPKLPSQEEPRSEGGPSVQEDPGYGRSVQDPACKAGRGSGRHTPLQARGGSRMHHQNHRPGQRNWDKVPESKETQTGSTITPGNSQSMFPIIWRYPKGHLCGSFTYMTH